MEERSREMVRLYAVYYRHDNPHYNTVNKLIRLRIVEQVRSPPYPSIVLDPLSPYPLSRSDKGIIERYGLVVVDASWRRVRQVLRRVRGFRRRLPLLLAANPVNYGKPYLLSSAEALAAGLAISGFVDDAHRVLSVFKWGDEFFKINKELLNSYAEAETAKEVIMRECRFIETIAQINMENCDEERLLHIVSNIVNLYIDKGK